MSVRIPTIQELELVRQQVYINTFGSDCNFDPSTPLGQLVSNEAAADYEIYLGVQTALTSADANQATYTQLDNIATLLNILRNAGLKTICYSCTLTGTNGTVIPQGSQASDINGVIFESAVEATIVGGIATVDFVSVDPGVFLVPANTLTTVVSIVSGWSTITNPTSGKDGAGSLKDNAFRRSLLTRSQNMAYGLPGAIKAGVEGVDQVINAFVYSNITEGTSPAPYLIPVGTIIVVVYYNDLSIETNIANAIWTRLPGCGTATSTAGGTQKTVTLVVNGENIDIDFLQAEKTPVNFVVVIKQESGFTSQNETDIKNAIIDYVTDNAEIKGTLEYSKVYNVAMNAAPDAIFENFYMSTDVTPGSTDIVPIEANFWEVFTPGTVSVEYGS
jgi:uncharacterized phage protein gp47/JayE